MSSGKDYSTNQSGVSGIDLNYRNKTIINQRGATIEINNSTDREELKLSQYSGSNVSINNLVNSELATNNKQVKVQNDSFESVGNDKNEFVGKDKVTRVVETTYNLKGFETSSEIAALSAWDEEYTLSEVPGINSQFNTLRGGYSIPPTFKSNTEQIGNRISNSTLNQKKFVLNNTFSSYCPVPIRSNDKDEVTEYEPVTGPLLLDPAKDTGPDEQDIETGSGIRGSQDPWVVKEGPALNAATEGGTWEQNQEKQEIPKLLEKLQKDKLNEIEQRIGNGGDQIDFLKRNKFETIGGAVNNLPSVRVDPEGRSQPAEVAVGQNTTYTNVASVPLVEDVNSDGNYPVGNYTLNVGNSYNILVGSGGVQIKTTGAVEIGGTSMKVAATKLNLMAEQGMYLTSSKVIELQSDSNISLRSKRQIYIEPGLGVKDNLIVGGGTFIEGELYVNHITAPVEIQQTEDTVALGRFNCRCDRELPIGEVQVGDTWYTVYAYGEGEKAENLIFNYPHSHHFKNIPLRVMDSNKDVRKRAQCEGINFPNGPAVRAQAQHHERKPILIHENDQSTETGDPGDSCAIKEKERVCPEEVYDPSEDICAVIEEYIDPNSSSGATVTNPFAGGGSGDYRTSDTSSETREQDREIDPRAPYGWGYSRDPETGQTIRTPLPSPEERLRANNPQFGQPARGFDQHQIDARRNNDD